MNIKNNEKNSWAKSDLLVVLARFVTVFLIPICAVIYYPKISFIVALCSLGIILLLTIWLAFFWFNTQEGALGMMSLGALFRQKVPVSMRLIIPDILLLIILGLLFLGFIQGVSEFVTLELYYDSGKLVINRPIGILSGIVFLSLSIGLFFFFTPTLELFLNGYEQLGKSIEKQEELTSPAK